MGAERFFNIKCRTSGLAPDAAVNADAMTEDAERQLHKVLTELRVPVRVLKRAAGAVTASPESVAVRFVERGAFLGARLCHLGTVALLIVAGLGLSVDVWYWLGVVAVAALLAYEHSLVRPGDLRRLDTAFFTMNGVISVTFFVFVLLDVL